MLDRRAWSDYRRKHESPLHPKHKRQKLACCWRIDGLTVRDDAPAPVRDAATRELRALVEQRRAEGRRVLVVPVLLSYGGIEDGIRKRLQGLDYVMAAKALAPDSRLVEWVHTMAADNRQELSLAPNVHC